MNFNDIGLKILTWIKKVKGESVDLESLNTNSTSTVSHDDWSSLLQRHVSDNGQVNYKGFLEERTLLEKYLANLTKQFPGKNWSEEEKIAYWINVYNAFTVKLIIDNYPLKSIKDIVKGLPMINSPWDIKFFDIENTSFDLNTVEHEILRKKFNEPRIHFAINCASISCPKLRNEAYVAGQLDEQLNDQAQKFILNPIKNNITTEEVHLSKIFDWFKSDFTREKPLLLFLQKYIEIEIPKNSKIKYLNYDWNLNE